MTTRPLLAALLLLPASSLWAQRSRRMGGGFGGLGGFRQNLSCPSGSKQVRLPGQVSVHCVMDQGSAPDAQAPGSFQAFAPARGSELAAPGGVIGAPRSVAAAPAAEPSGRAGYAHIMRAGIAADIPKDWHLIDAWKDETPTLYLEQGAQREGKQVTMVVSKIAPGQEGYVDMPTAISREKQWQEAKDGGSIKVGGVAARLTYVPHESRTAYVPTGRGTYYTLIYSAPDTLYDGYKPAFDRLLASFQAAR
jgi:hypothetical protein